MKISNQYKKWQLWFHYLVLSFIIYTGVLNFNNNYLYLKLLLTLIVSDIILHKVLQVTTGWRD